MTDRLFDAPKVERERWRGNRLPVVAPPVCPRVGCGRPLAQVTPAVQPALFFHGGYGAAQRARWSVCVACGWRSTVDVESVNPRTL